MISALIFSIALAAVHGQGPLPYPDYRYDPYYDDTPKPYEFSYSAPIDDSIGESSRTERGDGAGRVEGSYTLRNDEGHFRVVNYVADENGFRANVQTNEPGTDNKNPADVSIESAGPYSGAPYPYAYRPNLAAPGPAVGPLGAPVNAPFNAPFNVPVNAPFNAPINAPYNVPANAPYNVPINAPYNVPVNAPYNVPANAPYNVPVNAPYNVPTNALGPVRRPYYRQPGLYNGRDWGYNRPRNAYFGVKK